MRIALCVEALGPNPSGIGRYCRELVVGLSRRAEIVRLDLVHSGLSVSDPDELVRIGNRALPRGRIRRKLDRWSVRRATGSSLWHGPNYFLPDGVQGGVATIHDLSVLRFPETHPIERVHMFEKRFHGTLARGGHFITDTEAIRRELIAYAGLDESKVTAVALGVDETFAALAPDELAGRLAKLGLPLQGYGLCVSTIEPRKRIDRLLGAWRGLPVRLRERFPLVLVGSIGWRADVLEESIRSAMAEGWLTYLGFVADADLPVVYSGARLFIYPSLYEGFGLPPLEAMRCNVPTVIANEASLVEIAGAAAAVVEPEDREAFGHALVRGLEDEDWRSEAAEAGTRLASKFDWRNCIDRTVEVYRKVSNSVA